MSLSAASPKADAARACIQWMPTGFLKRGWSWNRMTT